MGETGWLLLALTLFAGAASPGPSLALVMRHAVNSGRRPGLIVALAHGLGVWLYALAVVFGLAALLTHLSTIMVALQLTGAVFLCYLGTGMIRSGLDDFRANHEGAAPEHVPDAGSYFRDGFLIVFLNPKIMVFFLAVFSQFLTPSQTLTAQLYAASLAGAIDAGWYALIAILVSGGSLWEWLEQHRQRLDVVFGVVLWGVSITIGYGILSTL